MSQLKTSPQLTRMLKAHRSEIISTWLASTRTLEGSPYQEQPVAELSEWLSRGFDTFVQTIETGSVEALDAHIVELTQVRLHLGFEMGDVIQGFLLLREVTCPLIISETAPETQQISATLHCFDVGLRVLIDRFCKVFSHAMHRSLGRISALEARHKIARELHDSVSQYVYGATVFSEAAIRVIEAGDVPKGAQHLRDARDSALSALRQMRLQIFELKPSDPESGGLVARLDARLASVESRAGVKIVFNSDDLGTVPMPVEVELFGIAQEALNNMLKHSQACCVTVWLHRAGTNVIMNINDDGIGFDPEEERNWRGMGLSGMVERAKEIGAEISIISQPEDGTRITVVVPVEPAH